MKIIAVSAISAGAERIKNLANRQRRGSWPNWWPAAHSKACSAELQFPLFTDGRAYSQALLLRWRYRSGDIHAPRAMC